MSRQLTVTYQDGTTEVLQPRAWDYVQGEDPHDDRMQAAVYRLAYSAHLRATHTGDPDDPPIPDYGRPFRAWMLSIDTLTAADGDEDPTRSAPGGGS